MFVISIRIKSMVIQGACKIMSVAPVRDFKRTIKKNMMDYVTITQADGLYLELAINHEAPQKRR